MDARQERGMAIAAMSRIDRTREGFIVPSQTGTGSYTVTKGDEPRCTCPDWELRRMKCKHIYAVEYFSQREDRPDGTTVITKAVRVTYKQDWPAYNAAQTHEEERFVELLRGLCEGIQQPEYRFGRPRLPLADVVYGMVTKVYGGMSGRRSMSALNAAKEQGLVNAAPHYNSMADYFNKPELTPLLKALIEESALPLKGVETDFAIDSTGFATTTYARWFDHKYGKMHMDQQWVKCHLVCGVKTNIVTSVEITDQNVNDSPMLPALLDRTARNFNVQEVSADKGYISKRNLQAIADTGAVPYIPFKVNTTGNGSALWQKLYHFYQFKRPEFLAHYHKRSNVETRGTLERCVNNGEGGVSSC